MSEPMWCDVRQHYCRCHDYGKRCEDYAAPQGTEGYGLCDDNLGNVPAVAAPSPRCEGDK